MISWPITGNDFPRRNRSCVVCGLGFSTATLLAIATTAFYALYATFHFVEIPDMLKATLFYFLPIVLPVVAATFMSFISINDLHRRVARYREMCHLLESVQKQIMVTHSWRSLEQLVKRTERTLLQEVLEWLINVSSIKFQVTRGTSGFILQSNRVFEKFLPTGRLRRPAAS